MRYLILSILMLSALFLFGCDSNSVTQTNEDEIDNLNLNNGLHNPPPILMTTAEITDLLNATYEIYIEAVINEDVETQMSYLGDHFVAFEPDLPVVYGKREARERLESYIEAGLDVQSMDRKMFNVWSHQGHIYEAGQFDFMIVSPGSKKAQPYTQKYVWTWEVIEGEPRTCSTTCVEDPAAN